MKGFLEGGWGPILIRCIRSPSPRHWLAYILLACLWLHELHSQSSTSHCDYIVVTPPCGAVSTRGRNRLSSPVCQDFWNGHGTLSSRGGAALMFEPQPISGDQIWLASTPPGAASTREHIVIVPVVLEDWRFGGFMNRVWDPIFPVCDGNAPR